MSYDIKFLLIKCFIFLNHHIYMYISLLFKKILSYIMMSIDKINIIEVNIHYYAEKTII